MTTNDFKPGDIVAVIAKQGSLLGDGFYKIASNADGILAGNRRTFTKGRIFNEPLVAFYPDDIVIPWNYDNESAARFRTYVEANLRPINDDDWIYRMEVNGQGWIMALRGLESCVDAMPHPLADFHSIIPDKMEQSTMRHILSISNGLDVKFYRYLFGSVFTTGWDCSFIDHSKPYERIEITL